MFYETTEDDHWLNKYKYFLKEYKKVNNPCKYRVFFKKVLHKREEKGQEKMKMT